MKTLFDQALGEVSQEAISYENTSTSIGDQIYNFLTKTGKTQKDLALLLGKKESEVSKWLTGTHNFTLKTIVRIEGVLNEKLIYTKTEVDETISALDKTVYFYNAQNSAFIRADNRGLGILNFDGHTELQEINNFGISIQPKNNYSQLTA